MLSKEEQKKLLKALKFDDAAIAKLVDDAAELPVEIPATVQIFTPEELTARDANLINQSVADAKKEAEKQGKELIVKAIKKKLNITDETKDVDKVIELAQAQFSKGDESLKEQVKLLQKSVEEKEQAIEQEKKNAQASMFDANLIASLPKNRKGPEEGGFTDQEYAFAIKQSLGFEHTDTGLIIKKGDQAFRDPKTQSPLPLPDVLNTFMTDRKWVTTPKPGGRGAGDSGAGGTAGAKTMSALQKQWELDNPGKGLISPEFTQHVAQVMKENPDFKAYE